MTERTRRTCRILVAEPSRTLATLIQLTLREVDAEFEFASDGREALTAARDRAPDLLITEAQLPGLDGYALVHAVRGLPGCTGVPVLLAVSDHTNPDPERLAYLGISDVLSKPFERAALLERVRALLDAAASAGEPDHRIAPTHTAPTSQETRPRAAASQQSATPQQLATPQQPAVVATGAGVADEVARQLPGALSAAVERVLPTLVDAAVERTLTPLVEAAVAARLPELVNREVDEVLATLVGATVESLLGAALVAELPAALAEIVDAPLRDAAEKAVRDALPDLLRNAGVGLGPWVEAVLRDVLPEVVPDIAEKIVWKVVPEMAEDLIREEIRRLTEEGEQ